MTTVNHGLIQATRIRSIEPRGKHIPCTRCGVIREARPDAMLCESCASTMTRAERQAWTA